MQGKETIITIWTGNLYTILIEDRACAIAGYTFFFFDFFYQWAKCTMEDDAIHQCLITR